MRDSNIICKPCEKSLDECEHISINIILFVVLISLMLLYPYHIVTNQYNLSLETNLLIFVISVITILISIFYFRWIYSWYCPITITDDYIISPRTNLKKVYEKMYGKGYFIPWSEIIKMSLSKWDSGWKCVFTTKYGDNIEVSSELKYPETCIPKLIELGNKLKQKGIEVEISNTAVELAKE